MFPGKVPGPFSLLLVVFTLFSTSCEKEVNINLSTGSPKLVVDGQIETNGYPFVILTRSIGYFSRIDLATIENNFVHGAVVTVGDGTSSIRLREYSVDTGFGGGNKFYFYSIDTADAAALSFKGIAGRTYTLKIESEDKVYESATTIPFVKGIDSMWFRKPEGKPEVPTSMLLFIKYTDPDTLGNYVRYFTQVNSGLFLPGISSVFEDDIVNGITIDSLNLAAGYDRSKNPNLDSLGFFFMNDTVTLKWCAIDKPVYDFYRTFEYATGTVGNPFASPVNVQSNIRGGALGVWSGYGSSYTTLIVPEQ